MNQHPIGSASTSPTQGHLFIISAPAGTGKTTLVNRLKQEMPSLRETISCTTRQPRSGEVQGTDYFFLSHEAFETSLREGAFLEWVRLYQDYYGTLHNQVQSLLEQGNQVILVIDTQGALKLKSKLKATLIFIAPPSIEELAKRLKGRGTETAEAMERRLTWASHEMMQAHLYDYVVINDNLEVAYAQLKALIQKLVNPRKLAASAAWGKA